jgi:hypothetical protein
VVTSPKQVREEQKLAAIWRKELGETNALMLQSLERSERFRVARWRDREMFLMGNVMLDQYPFDRVERIASKALIRLITGAIL